jgi:acyl carrier protein
MRKIEVEEELGQEVLRRLVAEVAAAYGVGEEQVRSTAAFRSFRGGDSLDVVQLVLALDDELRG